MSRGLGMTRGRVTLTQGWRGQIEVMSPGLTVAQGRHTGAIATSHGGMRTEGTDNSDVTWTQRDTRTSHGCHRNVTRGWRGLVVMSHGLTVPQGRVTL